MHIADHFAAYGKSLRTVVLSGKREDADMGEELSGGREETGDLIFLRNLLLVLEMSLKQSEVRFDSISSSTVIVSPSKR